MGSQGADHLLLLEYFIRIDLVFVQDTLLVFQIVVMQRVNRRVEHSDELKISFSEDFGLLVFFVSLLLLDFGFLVLNNLLVEGLNCKFELGEILLKSLSFDAILVLLSP